jgi:RNA polymerase sigma-70 factor, ECF subfamily
MIPSYSTAQDDPSDESLLQAITDRSPSAMAEFYLRYNSRLRSIVGSVVREEVDADDVLQDTMIQIWREAPKYSPEAGKPLGWVSTIARRRAIDRMRRGQSYRRIKERYASDMPQPDHGATRPTADDVERRDLRTFLNRQLLKLPAFQGQVVKLAFFNGLSHREIAAMTRTPLGTVKTRLELGLRKLTQAIRPLGERV